MNMKLLVAILIVGLIGCQTQPVKDGPKGPTEKSTTTKSKDTPSTITAQPVPMPEADEKEVKSLPDDNLTPDEAEVEHKPKPVPRLPKVGVIFGPGGGKVFGHIGVLQEFQKNKIPIYNVAGMEMGALVASLYAWRGSANDTEWQLFKIKSEDVLKKNLISSRKMGSKCNSNSVQ
jgi:NTE family protein